MTIKGGAYPELVFYSVRVLTDKGMPVEEAIKKVESILRGQIPDHIKGRIKQEVL